MLADKERDLDQQRLKLEAQVQNFDVARRQLEQTVRSTSSCFIDPTNAATQEERLAAARSKLQRTSEAVEQEEAAAKARKIELERDLARLKSVVAGYSFVVTLTRSNAHSPALRNSRLARTLTLGRA